MEGKQGGRGRGSEAGFRRAEVITGASMGDGKGDGDGRRAKAERGRATRAGCEGREEAGGGRRGGAGRRGTQVSALPRGRAARHARRAPTRTWTPDGGAKARSPVTAPRSERERRRAGTRSAIRVACKLHMVGLINEIEQHVLDSPKVALPLGVRAGKPHSVPEGAHGVHDRHEPLVEGLVRLGNGEGGSRYQRPRRRPRARSAPRCPWNLGGNRGEGQR